MALAHQGNFAALLYALRVLGAVDESGQIAAVEIAKAVDLLDNRRRVAHRLAQAAREGEDQIAPVGA